MPAGGLGGPVVDILGARGRHERAARRRRGRGAAPRRRPAGDHVLPVNLVLNLYEALKVAQSTRSPWIGVSVLELPALRRKLGAEAHGVAIPQTGVYIDDVFDPSPASRAGVRPGDFLLALGGHPLLSVGDFQTWLYVLGIGKRRARAAPRRRAAPGRRRRSRSGRRTRPRARDRGGGARAILDTGSRPARDAIRYDRRPTCGFLLDSTAAA